MEKILIILSVGLATFCSASPVSTNTPSAPSFITDTNDAHILALSVRDFYERERIDHNLEWKMPINFWGRVVDESNEPIANAGVHFVWNDLSENGTSEVDTKSDGNGAFSLVNQRGKGLSVSVGKDGYYATSSSRQSFEYAQPDIRFVPDFGNPVVFHLRKKGVGVDLITSQYGMKPYFGVTVPLDGKAVHVDILQRKSGDEGQLILSQIKPLYADWQQATRWSFKMEIPDGGFIEENDEFPFEAPEDGYQTTVEFDLDKKQSGWATTVRKDYYIKFGNPPRYGHLNLDTSIMMEGARLTYSINPDGSRNLEPK